MAAVSFGKQEDVMFYRAKGGVLKVGNSRFCLFTRQNALLHLPINMYMYPRIDCGPRWYRLCHRCRHGMQSRAGLAPGIGRESYLSWCKISLVDLLSVVGPLKQPARRSYCNSRPKCFNVVRSAVCRLQKGLSIKCAMTGKAVVITANVCA